MNDKGDFLARAAIEIAELIEALEDLIDDFESYLHECMDEPNRRSIVEAKELVAKVKGETP